tara:strand:+ start:9102 stop:10274 length:1173 start_codon:yes stop_codon:yes gene_type:complete
MKKILVINTKYKIMGGEDSNIVDEINLLKKNFEVEYLEFDNSRKLNIFDILAFFINTNIYSNKLLKETLKKFKPDLVYIHNTWFKSNLGVFKILDKRKINILLKIHNFRYDCSRHFLSSKHLKNTKFCSACNLDIKSTGIINKYYKDSLIKSIFLIRYSKKYFKLIKDSKIKILVLTEFHKEYLSNLGVNKNKIFVYFNPIQVLDYKDLNYQSKSDYVVYAGRLSEPKGVEELLKAWKKSGIKNIKLKVIGIGEIENNLKSQYSSENIEFLGLLSNEEAKKYIMGARAIITATKMYEGQPRLLCEASSFGVPSVYPSFGGMDEFFPSDYEYNFEQFNYDELTSKIMGLVKNKDLANSSNKIVEHISSKLSENQLLAKFNKIIEAQIDYGK